MATVTAPATATAPLTLNDLGAAVLIKGGEVMQPP
jgi:hypothetical protein